MTCVSVTPPRITRADIRKLAPTLPELVGILARNLPRLPWAERMRLLRLAGRIAFIRVQLLMMVRR